MMVKQELYKRLKTSHLQGGIYSVSTRFFSGKGERACDTFMFPLSSSSLSVELMCKAAIVNLLVYSSYPEIISPILGAVFG